jgi:hypothetical protein
MCVNGERRREKMRKGKLTTKRVGRAINLLNKSGLVKSFEEDYRLIADIILLLAKEEYMSATRAMEILDDAQKVIPYISELKLL